MVRLKIDDACPRGEGDLILVNFLNGEPTAAMESIPCTVLLDRLTKEKIYACEIDGMLYTGKIFTDRHKQTFVVKRNKVTGKVTIIGTKYVEMKPELLEEEQMSESDHSETDLDLQLFIKFGSKKQKQLIAKQIRSQVNVNTISEHMLNVANETKVHQKDLTPLINYAEDFYVPPIDRTALDVKDVYDISKILTDDEFEKIYSEIVGSAVFSNMVPWVQGLVAGKEIPLKLAVLTVYASSLLKLYNTVAKKICTKSFSACPYSYTLNKIILENFTLQNNRKILRPASYKDKTFCYAVVLILLVNGFKFDLDGLCETVKLSEKTVSLKIRPTGAKLVNIRKNKFVQLTLPLNDKRGFSRRNKIF